jgi:predicted dehydrogenase
MARELRTVLVGCGGMSHSWLRIAKEIEALDIVGLVDTRQEAAQERATQFGLDGAAISDDLEAVLRAARPHIVFDCTPPHVHAQATLTALEHGCHVLGEKPLADSMDNARRMVDAAQKADRIYAVIQNRRYDPRIRRLRAFIEDGQLGPLTTVNSDFYIGAHFGGFRAHMEHVLLLDMAIHTFDAARFLTGADPVAVTCTEWNPPGSWYDHDAAAVATFEMTGGIVYSYRGSWCAEGLNTTWESNWRLIGTNGSAVWDGAEGFEAQVVAETGNFFSECEHVEVPPHDCPQEKTGGHAGLIREFVQCVQTGETPETVCTDNIKSLAMVFGAIESAETGRRIEITA